MAEETPDLNCRSRLFKAATKVLSRRVAELSAQELAAFAEAFSQEMSLRDGAFPHLDLTRTPYSPHLTRIPSDTKQGTT